MLYSKFNSEELNETQIKIIIAVVFGYGLFLKKKSPFSSLLQ